MRVIVRVTGRGTARGYTSTGLTRELAARYLRGMYGDPRPLLLVTGAVVVGLGVWVTYVLIKMQDAWPVPESLRKPQGTAQEDSPKKD